MDTMQTNEVKDCNREITSIQVDKLRRIGVYLQGIKK